MRSKTRRRFPDRTPKPLTASQMANDCWSMDSMSDTLQHGQRFRTLNVLDDYNREILGIDIIASIPSSRVTRYLDQIADWRGCPQKIRVDNKPKFISSEFTSWPEKHHIQIDYFNLPVCINIAILSGLTAFTGMVY